MQKRRVIAAALATMGIVGGMSFSGASVLAQAKVQAFSSINHGFVKVRDDHFVLNGKPFYFAGTNNYYLNYDSHAMIDDVLYKAKKLGLKVVRMWGFMDGQAQNGVSMQPQLGVYDPTGFERLDYADAEAGKLGLRLVVTLVNNWNDFGGMNQYVKWIEGANGQHDDFYTNAKIVSAYERYVKYLITRKNQYTHVAYTSDPTIMTWELANEPRSESDPSGATLTHWVGKVSAYIHRIDPHHLIAVGDEGWFGSGPTSQYAYPYSNAEGVNWKQLLALPDVSYGTYHLYPSNYGQTNDWGNQWIRDHIQVARAEHKPAVLEEYGDQDLAGRDGVYQAWLHTMIKDGGAGAMFWMLSGTQDDGTPYPNYDGFAVYVPSSTATVLAYDAQLLNDLSSGVPLPKSAPQAFSQLAPVRAATGVSPTPKLTWSAALGATSYEVTIAASSDLSSPLVHASDVMSTDYSPPTPLADGKTYDWKVTAVNRYGVTVAQNAGESFTTQAPATKALVFDNFESYSSSAALQAAYTRNTGGDPLTVTLTSTHKNDGQYGMAYAYTLGSKGYAGVNHTLRDADWSGYAGIQFWLQPDGSGRSISIQFKQNSGVYWQASYTPTGSTGGMVQLPFSSFTSPSWSAKGALNLGDITQLSIYIGGSAGSGVLYFDSLGVYPPSTGN